MIDTPQPSFNSDVGAVAVPESLLDGDRDAAITLHHPGGKEPAAADTAAAAEPIWIWGVPLAPVTYEETLRWIDALIRRGKPAFFITANLHYAALSAQEPRLDEVNRKAAFLVADGMPMVWYSRLIGRPLPQRVTGADLIGRLCGLAAERGYRVFLLGGGPGVADLAAETLRRRHPALEIAGTAAPEIERLSAVERAALVASIRGSGAQLLLVALGQPKGELWLAENLEALGVPACVQLGASFDFVAGRMRRAPAWMQGAGLEWLYRIWCEPRRLLPRYAADALFLLRAIWWDMLAGRGASR